MEFRPLGNESSPFCRTEWFYIHVKIAFFHLSTWLVGQGGWKLCSRSRFDSWKFISQAEKWCWAEIANFANLRFFLKLENFNPILNLPTEQLVLVVLAFWRKPCSCDSGTDLARWHWSLATKWQVYCWLYAPMCPCPQYSLYANVTRRQRLTQVQGALTGLARCHGPVMLAVDKRTAILIQVGFQ